MIQHCTTRIIPGRMKFEVRSRRIPTTMSWWGEVQRRLHFPRCCRGICWRRTKFFIRDYTLSNATRVLVICKARLVLVIFLNHVDFLKGDFIMVSLVKSTRFIRTTMLFPSEENCFWSCSRVLTRLIVPENIPDNCGCKNSWSSVEVQELSGLKSSSEILEFFENFFWRLVTCFDH